MVRSRTDTATDTGGQWKGYNPAVTGIIQLGDSDAVSFNDDTSPDTRLTSNQRVSVDAQVIREASLDWYFQILQLGESIPGELKSTDIWPRFQALYGERKQRIWAGLSKVHIHIVDPRPYAKSSDDILREALRRYDAPILLREQIARKDPTALALQSVLRNHTAQRILGDSIAARVHDLSRFLNDGELMFAMTGTSVPYDPNVLSLDSFSDDKSIVRKVSIWTAKAAATFHEALDCFLEFDESLKELPNRIIRRRMEARVLQTHTFDKGENRHVELLEAARGNILANLRIGGGAIGRVGAKPYAQVDSVDSYIVQAADIAGGIASKIIETENLAAVASRFEYVSYNGSRVSVADMEEAVRRM